VSDPDEFAVARIIDGIPIRAIAPISDREFMTRLATVCRAFDIDATGDERGITFLGDGVEEPDQPLVFALEVLLKHRCGRDTRSARQ
jgi:hypothetical protein